MRKSALLLLLLCLVLACTVRGDDVSAAETKTEDPKAEESGPSPELIAAASATPEGEYFFFEAFGSDWGKRWIKNSNSKYDGEWLLSENYSETPEDSGLMMNSAGKLHAIAAKVDPAAEVKDETLVIQYEIKARNGVGCDGAYLKLLQKDVVSDLAKFDNDARYTIMFGPDQCAQTNKVHFILQHQNPVSKKWEEKHAKTTPGVVLNDRMTHLYTLIIRPDNSFEILVDLENRVKGNLLKDMDPPVNPEKMIDDPEDKKPADWVDEAKIDDPEAQKPDDWDESAPEYIQDMDAKQPDGWMTDEPLRVPDPEAKKPDDWDDEEDGDWEAPIIENPKCKVGCGEWQRPNKKNPAYKGVWYPPKIDNPAYKGPWAPRKIENKNWFEDLHPHNMFPIGAVGIELLSNTGGIIFDNILITTSEEKAKSFAMATWKVKNTAENAKSGRGSGSFTESVTQSIQVFQDQVLELYDEQPVVVLSVAGVTMVVIVLFFYLCCCISDAPAPPAPVASRKKTDEPTPDDEPEEEEDDGADDEIEEISTSGAKGSKPKKKTSRKD
mmetsp:Transcript_39604/g.61787  ORF Transcript_39604/g.61787 Transcript_39604/m.61787 type:complete len:552 (+) Transcript_39604:50-1705(+)|eukprot:CAMPEP_0184300470 /NCGR_PEP_ID=MMETSP1049-20130417/10869_1 /TAXON_ID=77928 /ORGANISM="Proteomonas sulcata, Strain CCMP704" /LENGTH=551 /DNA_ID=CAMNT_0026611193 /DNA_START=38 /DNA_END=1693 /DNA_ORIENTATION=+